jgi:hypothetical protein
MNRTTKGGLKCFLGSKMIHNPLAHAIYGSFVIILLINFNAVTKRTAK